MTMGGSGMGNTAFMGLTSLRLLGLGSFVGDIIIGGENSRSQNVCERQSALGKSVFAVLASSIIDEEVFCSQNVCERQSALGNFMFACVGFQYNR